MLLVAAMALRGDGTNTTMATGDDRGAPMVTEGAAEGAAEGGPAATDASADGPVLTPPRAAISAPPPGPAVASAETFSATTVVQAAGGSPGPRADEVVPVEPNAPVAAAVPCRNSVDLACGPFFYDWPVPNRPAVVTLTPSPVTPRVGEEVTFTVTVEDPDGAPDLPCTLFDSGGTIGLGACTSVDESRHGPWDPPPPSSRVETYSASFLTAGTFTVRYETAELGRCDGDCPMVKVFLDITVVP